MSVSSFISEIKSLVFGSSKSLSLPKEMPLVDDNFPDLESAEGTMYKKVNVKCSSLEMNSKQYLYEVEIDEKPIICGEVAIDINAFEKCKIIENYVSFMEVINYLGTPITERNDQSASNEKKSDDHKTSIYIAIDVSEGPLQLCSSNIM